MFEHYLRNAMRSHDWRQVFSDVENIGATSIPILDTNICTYLIAAMHDLHFNAQTRIVGKMRVRQEMDACTDFPEYNPILYFRDSFQVVLGDILREIGAKFFSTPLRFNDVRVHRYWPGSIGITPHVDGKSNKNLICIFVLWGHLQFYLCKNRSGNGPVCVPSTVGNLIMIRAPGFKGQSRQPFHRVLRSDECRMTLGLRQHLSN